MRRGLPLSAPSAVDGVRVLRAAATVVAEGKDSQSCVGSCRQQNNAYSSNGALVTTHYFGTRKRRKPVDDVTSAVPTPRRRGTPSRVRIIPLSPAHGLPLPCPLLCSGKAAAYRQEHDSPTRFSNFNRNLILGQQLVSCSPTLASTAHAESVTRSATVVPMLRQRSKRASCAGTAWRIASFDGLLPLSCGVS